MARPASPPAIKLIIVTLIFQILALVAYGLRIWARKLKRRSLDASDWLITASTILTLLLFIIISAGAIIGGAGYHQADITATSTGPTNYAALDNAAKLVFVAEMIWLTANAITKLSTLAFYNTVFRVSRFRTVVWILMGLTVAMFAAFVAKDFLICLPVQRNWSFEDPDAYCGVTEKGTLATGIGITLMDAIIVAAPMPSLLKLQMPVMKKVMICGIFSLGLVVCVISALRLASVMMIDQKDLTYTVINLGIFTQLEPLLAIIASCLPTLHPVLIRVSASPILDWTRRGSRSRKASTTGKRSNGTGGSTTLRGSENSKVRDTRDNRNTRNFNKLYDHLYPVTTTTVSEATVTSPGHEEFGYHMSNLPPWTVDRIGKSGMGGISVTKEFKVDSIHIENGGLDKPLPSVPETRSERDVEMGYGGSSWQPTPQRSGRASGRAGTRSLEDLTEPVSPMSMSAPRRF